MRNWTKFCSPECLLTTFSMLVLCEKYLIKINSTLFYMVYLQTVDAITAPASCPRLEMSAADPDVVVHSGQTKEIAVRVANLQVPS